MNNITNRILTVVAVLVLVVLFGALIAMGSQYQQYQNEIALAPASPYITLEEMHAYADKMGKPRMERLPWICPETGRNIYDIRQEQLDELGLEGYLKLHGLDG